MILSFQAQSSEHCGNYICYQCDYAESCGGLDVACETRKEDLIYIHIFILRDENLYWLIKLNPFHGFQSGRVKVVFADLFHISWEGKSTYQYRASSSIPVDPEY